MSIDSKIISKLRFKEFFYNSKCVIIIALDNEISIRCFYLEQNSSKFFNFFFRNYFFVPLSVTNFFGFEIFPIKFYSTFRNTEISKNLHIFGSQSGLAFFLFVHELVLTF